jgi:RING-box protein 1
VPPRLAVPGIADDAGFSIAWGCCGHVFHLDCISRWLKTRSVCPLCNREWEFAKIEKIATYGNLD